MQDGIKDNNGKLIWQNTYTDAESAYQIEHDLLFKAIRNNTALNDTEWAAKSTMTTLLGRMAVHSGKMLEWDEAINSSFALAPEKFTWDTEAPVLPDKDGNYPVAVPGISKAL